MGATVIMVGDFQDKVWILTLNWVGGITGWIREYTINVTNLFMLLIAGDG